jgi:phenylalanyl-tRNA synthetase alpha chain
MGFWQPFCCKGLFVQGEIEGILGEAQAALKKAKTHEAIEAVRVEYLGKKGKVSLILKTMGQMPESDRREFGLKANQVRDLIDKMLEEASNTFQQVQRSAFLEESIDVSLPGNGRPMGFEHPLAQMSRELLEAFTSLGFEIAHGPEIEHDFYNFEALNIPKDHPAREMQDTFYIAPEVVLRTQTSPVQIRTMIAQREPPIRIASPGRVYRRDQDVTHSPIFHQIELLYVDRNVSFADLKGTLTIFIEQIFGKGAKMRMRPSYFPFTEPSAEVDMSCFACDQKGCRLCKGSGWIEILGSGMVDPEVLKAAQLDPEKVSGFAVGMGVERLAMLKYGINDIRYFYENELRFLSQF